VTTLDSGDRQRGNGESNFTSKLQVSVNSTPYANPEPSHPRHAGAMVAASARSWGRGEVHGAHMAILIWGHSGTEASGLRRLRINWDEAVD
jgi:hypothetical protein